MNPNTKNVTISQMELAAAPAIRVNAQDGIASRGIRQEVETLDKAVITLIFT